MSSKIKIKVGPIEVECEASEEFIKNELLKMLSSVSELYKESDLTIANETPPLGEKGKGAPSNAKISWSTGTIASKLNSKTGADLIIASCAHLAFVAGKKSFTREEIHNKMKTATGSYKKTYSPNLSSYLQTLVKNDKLNELSEKDTYALNESHRKKLEKQLVPK